MKYRKLFLISFLLFQGTAGQSLAGLTSYLPRQDANLCSIHVSQHERLKRIPTHLLAAISKVESGRYNAQTKHVVAWPWTINVNGESRYFPSKAEAVHHVKELLAQGIKSIDVGCMQINLRHHPQAFNSIDTAFDPKANIEYAARFLSGLKENLGSWTKAVAYYHSANAQYHIPYRKKVYNAWLKERQNKDIPLILPANHEHPYTGGEKGYRSGSMPQSSPRHPDHSQWRLADARYQLAQYRARVNQAFEQKSRSKMIKQQPGKGRYAFSHSQKMPAYGSNSPKTIRTAHQSPARKT